MTDLTIIPHFKKTTNKEQCHSIYWNLLEVIERRSDNDVAPFYLREFYQTNRCDQIGKDFSSMRSDLESYLTEAGDAQTTSRILRFEETETDKAKATQAIMHYSYWHRRQLLSGLSWRHWGYYWTWYKAERMFAFIGILTLYNKNII